MKTKEHQIYKIVRFAKSDAYYGDSSYKDLLVITRKGIWIGGWFQGRLQILNPPEWSSEIMVTHQVQLKKVKPLKP